MQYYWTAVHIIAKTKQYKIRKLYHTEYYDLLQIGLFWNFLHSKVLSASHRIRWLYFLQRDTTSLVPQNINCPRYLFAQTLHNEQGVIEIPHWYGVIVPSRVTFMNQIHPFDKTVYKKKKLLWKNTQNNVNTNIQWMWFLNLLILNNSSRVDMPLKSIN